MHEKALIDEYLDADAAGKQLGIGGPAVRRLCRQRKIAHRIVGRRYLFTLDEIRAYIDSCAVQPEPARPESPPPVPACPTKAAPKATPVKLRHIKL